MNAQTYRWATSIPRLHPPTPLPTDTTNHPLPPSNQHAAQPTPTQGIRIPMSPLPTQTVPESQQASLRQSNSSRPFEVATPPQVEVGFLCRSSQYDCRNVPASGKSPTDNKTRKRSQNEDQEAVLKMGGDVGRTTVVLPEFRSKKWTRVQPHPRGHHHSKKC